jgi:uncharacterized membrane protein YadS
MCALIYAGNPAIALVMGMLISLTLNHPPLPYGNLFGKYALQTAIVLLGFKLNTGELMNISGTYALPGYRLCLLHRAGGLVLRIPLPK